MCLVERRAARHSFIASTVVTEWQSRQTVHVLTRDLSEYVCFVQTVTTLLQGTKINLEILYSGARFTASARVAYATAEGMGIVLRTVDDDSGVILKEWLK